MTESDSDSEGLFDIIEDIDDDVKEPGNDNDYADVEMQDQKTKKSARQKACKKFVDGQKADGKLTSAMLLSSQGYFGNGRFKRFQ